MYPVCDLHTHSTFSDGTRTPAQLVAQAQAIGLRAVALTDHNTVAGLPEFLNAAQGTTLKAIPGVEISTGYHGKELHIVGLFVRPDQFETLTDFLSVITQRKNASNRALIAALCQAGYELDYDEILGSHPGNVNRAVIASELLRKGYVGSVKEAVGGKSQRNGICRVFCCGSCFGRSLQKLFPRHLESGTGESRA